MVSTSPLEAKRIIFSLPFAPILRQAVAWTLPLDTSLSCFFVRATDPQTGLFHYLFRLTLLRVHNLPVSPQLLLLSASKPPASPCLAKQNILSSLPPRENTLDARSSFWGLQERRNEMVRRRRPRKGIITALTGAFAVSFEEGNCRDPCLRDPSCWS